MALSAARTARSRCRGARLGQPRQGQDNDSLGLQPVVGFDSRSFPQAQEFLDSNVQDLMRGAR